MKTFKDFLGEDYAPDTPTLDEFKKLIEAKCQPYLREVGGLEKALGEHAMFRGINRPTWKAIYQVRKDRKPRNSGTMMHNMLDAELVKQTGIKHRTESVFVTGAKISSGEYGSIHYVFPIGEYKIAYVDKVEDLTRHVWQFGSTTNGELYKRIDAVLGSRLYDIYETMGYGFRFPEEFTDDRSVVLKNLMGDIDESIYAGMDIQAAAYNIDSEYGDEILEYNIGTLKFETDNLVHAIKTRAEIMVNCDEYIAIPKDMVDGD